jgi:DNA-3-methyladenine glycosylase I
MEGRLERASPDYVSACISESWGFPVVSVTNTYEDAAGLEGLTWIDEHGEVRGLITWMQRGDRAEIVSLDAFARGQHIGGRLLDGAEAELRNQGVRTIELTTTNDNVRALTFYLRHGYRIVRLEIGGMDRVRSVKPGVPTTGNEGLPLQDMLQFEKHIAEA